MQTHGLTVKRQIGRSIISWGSGEKGTPAEETVIAKSLEKAKFCDQSVGSLRWCDGS